VQYGSLLHVERQPAVEMRKYGLKYRPWRAVLYMIEPVNWTETAYLREISESPAQLSPK